MKVFVALSAIFALVQGASLINRIVGGQPAQSGQFKFMASLRKASLDQHYCGATIIGRRALLTAAHCKVYNVSEIAAVVGITKLDDKNPKRYELESFTIHEDYDHSIYINDVAVIILKEDVVFSDDVQPITLASRPPVDEERLISAGWGSTSYPGSASNALQWMQVGVLNKVVCSMFNGNSLVGKICTLEEAGVGVCCGDSGGPLINELNNLAGITSDAYLCALGKPDFFTDVYYFRDWINAHAKL